MPFWLTSNLQKKLLYYVLQKIALLSNVDLSDFDVSLGSNSKFNFHNVCLMVDDIDIPDIEVMEGMIEILDIQLSVSGVLSLHGHKITIVVKPKNSNEKPGSLNDFSLAKSLHDLTASMIQFPRSFDLDDSNNMDIDEDSFKTLGKVQMNRISSVSSSSSNESDLAAEEGERNKSSTGTIQSMKNKLINNVLAKFKMILEDITLKIMVQDTRFIEIVINKIEITNTTNDSRDLILNTLGIYHVTKDNTGSKNGTQSEMMCQSISKSQTESTSLYMSALDIVNEEDCIIDGSEKKLELLAVNGILINVTGLSSINDMNLKELSINIESISCYYNNLLKIDEIFFDDIIDSLTSKVYKDRAKSPKSLLGYKRFQNEHSLGELFWSFDIIANKVEIILTKNASLIFSGVNIKQIENNKQTLKIDIFEITGNEFSNKKTCSPFLDLTLDENVTVIKIIDSLEFCFSKSFIKEIFEVYQNTASYLEEYYSKISKIKSKNWEKNKKLISLETGLIKFGINFQEYIIYVEISPISYTSKTGNGTIDFLKVYRCSKEKLIGNIIQIENISGIVSNSPFQVSSFDEQFNKSIIFTKSMISIRDIRIEDEYISLQGISKDILRLFEDIQELPVKSTTSKKTSYLKNSVRILNSSSIAYRERTIAKFVIAIESISININNFLNNEFGILFVRSQTNLISIRNNNEIFGFSRNISVSRSYNNLSEFIVTLMNKSDQKKPSLLIEKILMDKLRINIRNICFNYYAKYLPFINSTEPKQGKLISTDLTDSSIEIICQDFGLMLHPFRINSALLLIIDNFSINGDLRMNVFKSTLKHAKLLLTDDVLNIKTPIKQEWTTTINYYLHQGFSAIGKLGTTVLNITKTPVTQNLDINIESLGLSLCADSFNTLTSLTIDLKIPLTFSDEEKYKSELDSSLDIFTGVDMNFFDSNHIKKRNYDNIFESSSIHIVNEFLDRSIENLMNRPSSSIFSNISNSDISTTKNNKSMKFKEDYLDDVEFEKTEIPKDDEDINIVMTIDHISVKLFDGYDWKYTRKSISQTIDLVEKEVEETQPDEEIDVQLQATIFDSIFISTTKSDVSNLKMRVHNEIQGDSSSPEFIPKVNLRPSKYYKTLVEADNIIIKHTAFSTIDVTYSNTKNDCCKLSTTKVSISKFEVIDNIPSSTWNKFLTVLKHKKIQPTYPMFAAEFTLVRPITYLQATELIMDLKIAPLRFHVDQDTLDFLLRFGGFKDSRFTLIDEYPEILFIQKFSINSVKIVFDYKPKKVNYSGLRSGQSSEIVNFFILDGAKFTLKNSNVYGLSGLNELNAALKEIWTPDITSSQLGGIVAGVGPLKSAVTVGSTVKNLITVPIEEYKQEGNIGKGIQKGVNVFLKTASGDFLRIGAKVASGTQAILENTEEFFGGSGLAGRLYNIPNKVIDMDSIVKDDQLVGGSNPKVKNHRPVAVVLDSTILENVQPKVISLYADQPLDIHKGLEEAYHSLEKHMHIAYSSLKNDNPTLTNTEEKPTVTAISMAKAAPIAIIRPLIGATEAISKTLQGISNQLDKDQFEYQSDKYKSIQKETTKSPNRP